MTIHSADPSTTSPRPSAPHPTPLRVLIIAENASFRFGGEAVLPLHYFRGLRNRGIPVWVITNHRNKAELTATLPPEELALFRFLPDGALHKWFGRIARFLPQTLASFTIGQAIEIIDQFRARTLARQLIKDNAITLIHQPTPVSPRHVSVIDKLGIPVVMGPMNGNITYPLCFRNREQSIDRLFVPIGRAFANLFHRLFPGKRHAASLLVANQRTADALPHPLKGQVHHVVENGVDLSIYRKEEAAPRTDHEGPVRFAFAGRLVNWKGVDLLLEAVAKARLRVDLHLDILGEGPVRPALQEQARTLGIADIVTFHGWLSHQACADILGAADAFVLPSLRECGGAVVLEAMAMRLPVIASHWGGPADYLDDTCGILVPPLSQTQFIHDLAEALVRLAKNPDLRHAMGDAGYQKIATHYDWNRKLDQVLPLYREALESTIPH